MYLRDTLRIKRTTLPTYLQFDVNPNKYKKLHKIIVGLYEISNKEIIGFKKEDNYNIIYQ